MRCSPWRCSGRRWRRAPRPVTTQAQAPDPLIALADAARADAALAAAVIAATPTSPGGSRRCATHAPSTPPRWTPKWPGRRAVGHARRPPPAAAGAATLDALRRSVAAAGESARQAALGADARRVGLVASVAACCTTYAALFG